MFYPMSMGKLTGTLGNAKHLASSPDLPATKLHGSCSHLPFASLQFFFTVAQIHTVSREKHHPIVWQLGEFTERRELGIGQAQPHMFIC